MPVLSASQQVQDQHVEARDEHSSESSLSVKDYTKMRYYMSRVTKDRRRSRGQGRFACDNCDRRYHQMKNLRRHVINECGKQPMHQCAFCPYRATYRSYLQVHMMKHARQGFTPRTATVRQHRNP
ncbi:uncharacterized protein LOC143149471 [Ptiloglossa arizonensis]|uniref:uncharacterized protein LOC143149471 n=1 Tax=Ptiloglossa arizonensis TaxID=3350558 RepID=UPI003F9F8AA6